MSNENPKIHLGVYGLCMRDDKILVIKKSRGAYINLYDLPGGRLEFGESIEECLKREYNEEIGVGINIIKLIGVFEYQCDYLKRGIMTHLHHVGVYYLVDIDSVDIRRGADGHDSLGASFVETKKLNKDNMSGIFQVVLGSFLRTN